MPALRRTKLMELVWKLHPWLYRVSGGRVGGSALGMPVLLLTTTGRKSGEPRTTALTYLTQGDACVVIASYAGEPRHPSWWLNLEAAPRAHVQRGSRVTPMRAREAEGEERERLWAEVVERESGYATYQERTSRRIPVVVLEPETSGT
jgi:deazaflavin-dependent oxidoreductase (nitroreductase family)